VKSFDPTRLDVSLEEAVVEIVLGLSPPRETL